MSEIINEKAVDVSVNGTSDKEESKEEKMFTQSQLEEIISERLGRERKVNEALSSVKQLLKSASEKGLLKGKSYSEMAKELVERLSEKNGEKTDNTSTAENVQDDISVQAETTSSVADGDGNENAADACGHNEEREKKNEENFISVLSGIKAKYPQTAVEKLLSGNKFEMFAKGRSGSTEEIFDDFYSFMSSFENKDEAEANEKNTSHAELASTAFSSHSGAPETGTNLTAQQMEIAKSAGMSYREYAHLLESIPKRTGRTV